MNPAAKRPLQWTADNRISASSALSWLFGASPQRIFGAATFSELRLLGVSALYLQNTSIDGGWISFAQLIPNDLRGC